MNINPKAIAITLLALAGCEPQPLRELKIVTTATGKQYVCERTHGLAEDYYSCTIGAREIRIRDAVVSVERVVR